ncbi:MAG: isochorismatase family protein [Bermanella sp.]
MRKLLITFISSAMLMLGLGASVSAEQIVDIKTVNGVGQYPDNYLGTPHRAASEDPFISPTNAALVLIDYQPHILMGVKSIDHETLMNNTIGLIKSAVHFKLPIIFSHVGVGLNSSKPFLEDLKKWAPDAVIIDRTNVNAWEEPEFVAAIAATGRKKLIMGGLWTDVCLAYPAIEASMNGYEVLVPEDTVGSITQLSHENGMKRMIQAGVKPITWNVVLAELQRDHARRGTEHQTTRIFLEHLFKMDPDKGWQ